MDWRYVHVGLEGDNASIGGMGIWKHQWRDLSLRPLHLPHPSHPDQLHIYNIYEIGELHRPVRFAAGELSNGVWGFYAPK